MLILSPSRLINGNHPSAQQTEPNIGLPPPEVLNESVRKKKKRFGRSKKKFDVSTQEFTLNPPRFSQMQDRTLSFGDNSFDADNAAYNLHAFVVRLLVHRPSSSHAFVSVPLRRDRRRALRGLREESYQSAMVLLQRQFVQSNGGLLTPRRRRTRTLILLACVGEHARAVLVVRLPAVLRT